METKKVAWKKTNSGYNTYDKYGKKTGSFKKTSSGKIIKYDKYGAKTGSFKKDFSGKITEYDKYGRKIGTYKK